MSTLTKTGSPPAMVHRIVLLETKVRPAYVAIGPGDTVRFVNHSNGVARLEFHGPNGTPFEEELVPIGKGQSSETFTVAPKAEAGRYKYRVVVKKRRLKGESSPEIIIDR